MIGVQMIVFLCFVFLQMTLVISEISWESCGSDADDIKLLNLTVTPYPIVAPGSLSVEVTIHNNQDITGSLKAGLTLRRKMFLGSLPVPCINGIGSCTYDNLCTLVTQLGCPLKAGDHSLTLPITIDSGSWALVGNYFVQVNIETGSGQKGCIKLSNVHIQSNK